MQPQEVVDRSKVSPPTQMERYDEERQQRGVVSHGKRKGTFLQGPFLAVYRLASYSNPIDVKGKTVSRVSRQESNGRLLFTVPSDTEDSSKVLGKRLKKTEAKRGKNKEAE